MAIEISIHCRIVAPRILSNEQKFIVEKNGFQHNVSWTKNCLLFDQQNQKSHQWVQHLLWEDFIEIRLLIAFMSYA